MRTNQLPEGMVTFLNKYEPRTELILWIFFMFTLILRYLETELSSTLIGISLTTLSIFYFLISFIPLKDIKTIRMIAIRVVNIGSSVCLIGIMYKILSIPGANIMMSVGLLSMISAGAIIILTSLNDWTDKTTRIALRIILIGVIGFAF
jgi:hypothetical protein